MIPGERFKNKHKSINSYNKTKMGKKFFGVIAFVAIATAAGWNYQQNKQSVELSDLALENVEALARNESGKNNKALAQKANGEY